MRDTERVVWISVSMTVWYQLSFFFLESAIKGNIYLDMLELFAFLQIVDIKSEMEAAVFSEGTGPRSVSVATCDVP